jgi:hypothetical protein
LRRRPYWSGYAATCGPATEKFANKSAAKARPASREGTTKMNKDVTRPTETGTYGPAKPPTTRRLLAIEDGKSAALQAEITQDAISKA